MDHTPRYSDQELEEFRVLILEKLRKANEDYDMLRSALSIAANNEALDTSPTFKLMEEGTTTFTKEEAHRLAQRQLKFIDHLERALQRIDLKTYGICRVTGQLISKERLRAVPHATLSIEAKNQLNS